MHFLEIVFCDCSMFCLCGHGVAFILWRLCFLIVPIQEWSFTAQVCASGIQPHLLQKNRLVGASSECRDALKVIPATWSCIDSLEIVFCDCSMLCRGCPWTWNGRIENWVLVSVGVACDCKDWFVFSMIIQNCWTSAEDGWLIAPALAMCGARLL